jgi:hypothetical protein
MWKLFLIKIIVEKKKGIERKGERKEKERSCSRVIFLILLFTKRYAPLFLFLNFLA